MEIDNSIERIIRSYKTQVTIGLDDADSHEEDALLVLTTRDVIEERWKELSASQRLQVEELDNLLIQKRDRIIGVLSNSKVSDRKHWWWFLDEGPQVRDEARAA